MHPYDMLLARRKWHKENARQLRKSINNILKRDHTVNADSYMRNKELSVELEIFFGCKDSFIQPNSQLNTVLTSLAAIGLLVSVLTPNTLRGVNTLDALIAKLESMRRVVNSEINECETKYPELSKLYDKYNQNAQDSAALKIQMNSFSGLNSSYHHRHV